MNNIETPQHIRLGMEEKDYDDLKYLMKKIGKEGIIDFLRKGDEFFEGFNEAYELIKKSNFHKLKGIFYCIELTKKELLEESSK